MSHQIDELYFEELTALDPDEVCRRTSSRFDKEKSCYYLNVWGRPFEISLKQKSITQLTEQPQPVDIFLGLFIILYLLRSKNIHISGQWISEKDMPGGVAFFSGPHTIPSLERSQSVGMPSFGQ